MNYRKQTNAFAMQSGMMFGLFWCLSFLFLVCGNETLRSMSSPLIIITPFVGFLFARKFRKDVQNDGEISFGRAYMFSTLMYLYATAILAILSYFYFKFIDNGAFAEQNIQLLNRPDVKQLFSTPEIQGQMNGLSLNEIKNLIKSFTPTTISAAIINFNVFAAFILALPTAFFAMNKKR